MSKLKFLQVLPADEIKKTELFTLSTRGTLVFTM